MQAPGSMDCGLCAAQYILHRCGLDAGLESMRRGCDWLESRGAYVPSIVEHLCSVYGLETLWPQALRERYGKLPGSLQAYRDLLGQGWVGIFERRLVPTPSHIMVVDGIDHAGRLLITCSLHGRRWWATDEFFGGWDGKGDGWLWWLVKVRR